MTMGEWERQEMLDRATARGVTIDMINDEVGDNFYIRRWDLPVRGVIGGVRIALRASRWYEFARVMVDFRREAGDQHALAAKRLYCQRNEIRYVLMEDEHDLEAFDTPAPRVEAPAAPARRQPTGIRRPKRGARAASS